MTDPTYQFIKGQGWVPTTSNVYLTVKTRNNVLLDLIEIEDPEKHIGEPHFMVLKDPTTPKARWYTWWNKDGSLNPAKVIEHFTRYDWDSGWSRIDQCDTDRSEWADFRFFILVPHE